jgi:hypothetical protein
LVNPVNKERKTGPTLLFSLPPITSLSSTLWKMPSLTPNHDHAVHEWVNPVVCFVGVPPASFPSFSNHDHQP